MGRPQRESSNRFSTTHSRNLQYGRLLVALPDPVVQKALMGDPRAMKSLPDETGTQRVASRPRGGEMGPPAGRRIWSICGPVPATRRRGAFSPGIAFSIHQTELAASRTSVVHATVHRG
jgi:hypothetical protein